VRRCSAAFCSLPVAGARVPPLIQPPPCQHRSQRNTSRFPANQNCGNCSKISSSAPLTLLDYFTPLNTVSESNGDFGSGGPLLLPDVVDASGTTRHLAVGAEKDQNIYVVDRDNMGKFNPTTNNIYQEITGQLADGMWSKPATSTTPSTSPR
jgi:hypothetical protein